MANIIEIIPPAATEVIEIAVPGMQGPAGSSGTVDMSRVSAVEADLAAATDANTASTLVRRSAAGAVSIGTVSTNAVYLGTQQSTASAATRKDYVDSVGTSAATASTIVRRDTNGNINSANSIANAMFVNGTQDAATNALTRKDYVDALGVATNTPNTIVRRDASGNSTLNRLTISQPTPVNVFEAVRKDYVDAEIRKAIFYSTFGNSPWAIGGAEPFPRPSSQVAHSPDFATFACFTAPVANTITKLSVPIENAGAGITWFQMALYTVAADNQFTLTARTANEPTRAQTAGITDLTLNTTGGYPASFTFVPGQRYAFGLRCMGTTIFGSQSQFFYTGSGYAPVVAQRYYMGTATGFPSATTFYPNGSWWNAPYIVGMA